MSFFVFSPSLAVPVNSLKEAPAPALISALLKEDVELYSQEMKHLLYGPMKQFIKTIQFKTKGGNTIFHLMAGVQSHREFFAEEMQKLIGILVQEKSGGRTDLVIGGITIYIPYLEDTELGQSIKNKDVKTVLSIIARLKQASTIEWLTNFPMRTREGQLFKDFVSQHLERDQILYLWKANLDQTVKKNSHISLLMKNDKGLSPKDIAYQSGNFPAYSFLSDYIEKSGSGFISRSNLGKLGFGIGAILGAGLSLGWGSVPYDLEAVEHVLLFKSLETAGYGYLGGVAIGLSTTKCYDVFRKMKTNRLHKRAIGKHRQL